MAGKKDYYGELDKAIKRYEEFKPCRISTCWITDRIDWCWRFRKISQSQMHDLTERMVEIFNNIDLY